MKHIFTLVINQNKGKIEGMKYYIHHKSISKIIRLHQFKGNERQKREGLAMNSSTTLGILLWTIILLFSHCSIDNVWPSDHIFLFLAMTKDMKNKNGKITMRKRENKLERNWRKILKIYERKRKRWGRDETNSGEKKFMYQIMRGCGNEPRQLKTC